jgi:RNA polymerase sigma-70 factor (ECF subfamily)
MTQSPIEERNGESDATAVKEPADGVGESERDRSEASSPNWARLVEAIRAGREEGMTALYQIFARGIRYHLCRQLGPNELDDRVHDTFLIVVQAIRRGDLREPERLMGFVRTIVRRQVAAYIEHAVHERRQQAEVDHTMMVMDACSSPEQTAINHQRRELIIGVLSGMPERDREILTRFYLFEQTQEQICDEMSLTETQFRLFKSRAKARFGEIGKKKLQRPFSNFFMRTSARAAH